MNEDFVASPDAVPPAGKGADVPTAATDVEVNVTAADRGLKVRGPKQSTMKGKACIVQWVSTIIFALAAVYIMAVGDPRIRGNCDLAGVAFISCAICWCEAFGQSFLAAATWTSDDWEVDWDSDFTDEFCRRNTPVKEGAPPTEMAWTTNTSKICTISSAVAYSCFLCFIPGETCPCAYSGN